MAYASSGPQTAHLFAKSLRKVYETFAQAAKINRRLHFCLA